MNVYSIKSSQPTFKKYIKITGEYKKLESFRENLSSHNNNFTSFIQKKTKEDSSLYIFSGKEFNKVLDYIMSGQSMLDFRLNPQKFINKKPKILSLKNAIEKLKNKGKKFL